VFLGEPSVSLLDQAQAEGVASRVVFLGHLTDAQLAAAYRGADLVLFASLHEGFGLPVVEAQASGTPVITSTTTSLPEVAGNGAVLVDPRSTESIADAIERVLSNESLHTALVREGLRNAARFTWEGTADRVRQVATLSQ
jgi:glycosyltransferase involved in cell wall biosynthesis